MLALRTLVRMLGMRQTRKAKKLSLKQEEVGYEGERTAGCRAQGAPAPSAGGRRRRRRRPSCSEEVEQEQEEK